MISLLVRSFVPRTTVRDAALPPPIGRSRGLRIYWERDSAGRLSAHWVRP
jgi:hypothetical protein